MSAQSVIDEFKMPCVGRCIAAVTDEVWQDERGMRPMQMWAAEASVPLLEAADHTFWLALDRAAQKYVEDMAHYAQLNNLPIDELITCPVRVTPPQERQDGRLVSYLYGRVERLEHGN